MMCEERRRTRKELLAMPCRILGESHSPWRSSFTQLLTFDALSFILLYVEILKRIIREYSLYAA